MTCLKDWLSARELEWQSAACLLDPTNLRWATEWDFSSNKLTVPVCAALLADAKIKYFSAQEILRPHRPDTVWRCSEDCTQYQGQWYFGPPEYAVLPLLVLHRIGDLMREAAKEPVHSRNWWRPLEYNHAVGGAPRSDHIWASAVDFDFKTRGGRRRADKLIVRPLFASGLLAMSVGRGARTLHVGLFAPETYRKGQREWKY